MSAMFYESIATICFIAFIFFARFAVLNFAFFNGAAALTHPHQKPHPGIIPLALSAGCWIGMLICCVPVEGLYQTIYTFSDGCVFILAVARLGLALPGTDKQIEWTRNACDKEYDHSRTRRALTEHLPDPWLILY